MSPFMQYATVGKGGFVFGGLLPDAGAATNEPSPSRLFQEVLGWTNLVCYNSEASGQRTEAWIYLSQLFRLIFHKAQLPDQSAGVRWLLAIVPRLGNCVTAVTRAGTNQLTFARKSTVGLSALAAAHCAATGVDETAVPRMSATAVVKGNERRLGMRCR